MAVQKHPMEARTNDDNHVQVSPGDISEPLGDVYLWIDSLNFFTGFDDQ